MNNNRKIVILGSTGSIGENALRIVQTLPPEHRQEVIALAAHSNYKRLLEQAAEFNVKNIALMTHDAAEAARAIAPKDVCVHEGVEGMCTLATLEGNERLICAIVGMAALPPVVAAINAGIDVAIATKEVLVAAGQFVCRLCEEKKVNLYPIDSEHSAIFQCCQRESLGNSFNNALILGCASLGITLKVFSAVAFKFLNKLACNKFHIALRRGEVEERTTMEKRRTSNTHVYFVSTIGKKFFRLVTELRSSHNTIITEKHTLSAQHFTIGDKFHLCYKRAQVLIAGSEGTGPSGCIF